MTKSDRYPLLMTHPNARKSVVTIFETKLPGGRVRIDGASGTPDILPPVTVTTPDDEDYQRSRGYRAPGDEPMPETETASAFARYPMVMRKGEEEKIVLCEPEESHAAKLGFTPAGTSDPAAYDVAIAAPLPPDYVPQEYPKWVGDKIVQSREEELALARKPANNTALQSALSKAVDKAARSEKQKAIWAARKAAKAAAQAAA